MRSDARKRLAVQRAEEAASFPRSRVTSTCGALYSKPRTARKRRRCDGHLSERHWIEVGDRFVWSALPPDDPDIGNVGWWHCAFCLDCAPIEHAGG